jgi:hypothetical protein
MLAAPLPSWCCAAAACLRPAAVSAPFLRTAFLTGHVVHLWLAAAAAQCGAAERRRQQKFRNSMQGGWDRSPIVCAAVACFPQSTAYEQTSMCVGYREDRGRGGGPPYPPLQMTNDKSMLECMCVCPPACLTASLPSRQLMIDANVDQTQIRVPPCCRPLC